MRIETKKFPIRAGMALNKVGSNKIRTVGHYIKRFTFTDDNQLTEEVVINRVIYEK
jgi:hypothetical protein